MSAVDETATAATHSLQRWPETIAVVRLAAGTDVPAWVESSSVFSVTATATETSVVCAARSVPTKTRHERPYTAFAVQGPLDLARTGVLVALLQPLAEAGIAALPLSTFDTTWLLVPTGQADRAEEEWRRRGHQVAPAVPVTTSGRKSSR